MKAINAFIKAQSPAVQSLIYAIETGVIAALVLFGSALYAALSSSSGLAGFDWHGQVYTLEMGVAAAIVKAVLDFLKGNAPTQTGASK